MVLIGFKKVLFLVLVDIISFEKLSNAGLALKLNTKLTTDNLSNIQASEEATTMDELRGRIKGIQGKIDALNKINVTSENAKAVEEIKASAESVKRRLLAVETAITRLRNNQYPEGNDGRRQRIADEAVLEGFKEGFYGGDSESDHYSSSDSTTAEESDNATAAEGSSTAAEDTSSESEQAAEEALVSRRPQAVSSTMSNTRSTGLISSTAKMFMTILTGLAMLTTPAMANATGYTEGGAVLVRHGRSTANDNPLFPFADMLGIKSYEDAPLSNRGMEGALDGNARKLMCANGIDLRGCGQTDMRYDNFVENMDTQMASQPRCPRPTDFTMISSPMTRAFQTGLATFAPEIINGMLVRISNNFREVKGNSLSPDAHPSLPWQYVPGAGNYMMREQLEGLKEFMEDNPEFIRRISHENPEAALLLRSLRFMDTSDFPRDGSQVVLTHRTPAETSQLVDYENNDHSFFGTDLVQPTAELRSRMDGAIEEIKEDIRAGRTPIIATHSMFIRSLIDYIRHDADVNSIDQEDLIEELSRFRTLRNGRALALRLSISPEDRLVVTRVIPVLDQGESYLDRSYTGSTTNLSIQIGTDPVRAFREQLFGPPPSEAVSGSSSVGVLNSHPQVEELDVNATAEGEDVVDSNATCNFRGPVEEETVAGGEAVNTGEPAEVFIRTDTSYRVPNAGSVANSIRVPGPADIGSGRNPNPSQVTI